MANRRYAAETAVRPTRWRCLKAAAKIWTASSLVANEEGKQDISTSECTQRLHQVGTGLLCPKISPFFLKREGRSYGYTSEHDVL